jgi:hypothetical protein
MEGKDIGALFGAFIVILVGVVLLNNLANSIYSATTISTVTANESVAITTGVGTLANKDVTIITFFGSSNVSTNSGGVVLGTQVNITDKATSTIRVDKTNFSNGNWNCTYQYEGAEYVTDSTSRTLISLTTLFFVISIVLVGYFLVMRSYNNMF